MPKPLLFHRSSGWYIRFLVPVHARTELGSRFIVRALGNVSGDQARLVAAHLGYALSCIAWLDYRALGSYADPDTRKEMVDVVAQVRDGLVARCPDIALLGDIADAAKHARLTTPKTGARLGKTLAG